MLDHNEITHIIPNVKELDAYVEVAGKYSLGFEYNDFFIPDLLDDPEEVRQRIAVYNGLGRPKGRDTLHGAFLDIVPFSQDSGIRKHSIYRMQQSVEIAGELGCRGVIFHTGLIPDMVGDEKYRSHWLESMADTVRMLLKQDSSIEIYCENMFDESPQELAELAKLLQEEERFGVCLDIGHMMLKTKEPAEWFRILGSSIRHFHMNDNYLKRDNHLALGDGEIDWNDIFALMSRHGLWDRSRLLEVSDLEKIHISLDYLEKQYFNA
ncbi:MAG: sugar phosphate isomerase/epimerase [Bacteroidales bacterium]|nr:sugar phosphate isomerase/epimerase [Lachnoclostridium sp.]MCM1384580.1 sugar phosphate isomerase/epimerase [Lachnoclostridium sp.]MCM1465138.1 sugar phosphate isomerase/epimerase [Bacteroidales bacterium]